MPSHWICCQIGAREHYAVPRAVQTFGGVCRLFTDVWVKPSSVLASVKPLRERFHAGLGQTSVKSWDTELIARELLSRAGNQGNWKSTMDRNRWFQDRVVRELKKEFGKGRRPAWQPNPTVFCYSYAAKDILQFARSQGWTTILGQIDPGEEQEKVVKALVRKHAAWAHQWKPAPARYWDLWRQECALADHIVVNSSWSKTSLQKSGVAEEKITVVPLAYEPPEGASNFARVYPKSFNRQRPMRALVLGQIILLKGVVEVLQAASLLREEPIEFWMVGHPSISIPDEIKSLPSVRWHGHVNRSEVAQFYREADVFLFPSWSDGFGLTQLEAQSWKLPVVASPFCGDVVQDGVNGQILEPVSANTISDALVKLLMHPERLQQMSAESGVASKFTLQSVGQQLAKVARDCELVSH